MSHPCDRTGDFRGSIIDYGIREEKSGAVAITIKVALHQWWNGGEWIDWAEYDQVVDGAIYVINKNSDVLEKNVASLVKYAGWDNDFLSIDKRTWEPSPIAVSVTAEEYNGNTRFRASFVNDYNRTPGAMSNVSGDKVKELQSRFGSQLRAIGGNAKRSATPPAGKPPAPPAHKSSAPTPPPSPNGNGRNNNNDIPF